MARGDPYSTDAKRKALAARVSKLATETLGIPVTLERGGEGWRDEYKFHLEHFETMRGPVSWLCIDVDSRGVDVHSKFGFPQFAPGWGDPNRYSGKWNHYLWTDADSICFYLESILKELRPIETRPRADWPRQSESWMVK